MLIAGPVGHVAIAAERKSNARGGAYSWIIPTDALRARGKDPAETTCSTLPLENAVQRVERPGDAVAHLRLVLLQNAQA